jgi:predicted SAM-dependent methyltransferase
MKLDLACGQRCHEGFLGVDLRPGAGVSFVVDLFRTPWPFERASVTEVWCSHFIEHTPDLVVFMDELHRILQHGAIATLTAPYYTSMRAYQDPTHMRSITDATFVYFSKAWREREGLSHYPIVADFEVVRLEHAPSPAWANVDRARVREAMQTQWNVIDDILVVLRKP